LIVEVDAEILAVIEDGGVVGVSGSVGAISEILPLELTE